MITLDPKQSPRWKSIFPRSKPPTVTSVSGPNHTIVRGRGGGRDAGGGGGGGGGGGEMGGTQTNVGRSAPESPCSGVQRKKKLRFLSADNAKPVPI